MRLKPVVLLVAAVVASGLSACSSPGTTELYANSEKIGVVDCKNNKVRFDDSKNMPAKDKKFTNKWYTPDEYGKAVAKDRGSLFIGDLSKTLIGTAISDSCE